MAVGESFARRWRIWTALFWLVAMALLIYGRWDPIHWFALGDTDDNMRMMQVRGLLSGQDWSDLRQHRLDPPFGADIHWSRLVDLPLAGLIVAFKPFMSGAMAERAAAALAPMLPMGLAIGAVALSARRLVAPGAFPFALALLLCAHSARGMWAPLRIDHHGWQLAMLALVMLGFTDRRRARGGLIAGLASAVSLAIGLELLIYLAAAGGLVALLWVRDAGQSRRLAAYGASLAGGCACLYLLFTSQANSAPVCDAFSPVWLSAMIGAGAIAVLLSFVRSQSWIVRFAAASVAGGALAIAFALAWPTCLGRLEGVSPQLAAMWLDNVREARPIYRHSWQVMANVLALPIAGLIGYALMLWRSRRDAEAAIPWTVIGALALTAFALLFWQSRAGPAAQLLAIPGATALLWLAARWAFATRGSLTAGLATALAFFLISGLFVQRIPPHFQKPAARGMKAVNTANGKCPTLAALRPVAFVPKGYVLTFVDLGPRLIAVTHHDAVAGPYHRNGKAILDVMLAFRGSADNARGIVARRGIDYVLICPGLSESTAYAKAAPKGFYAQLAKGNAPAWLEPIALPARSPYRMWRVRR